MDSTGAPQNITPVVVKQADSHTSTPENAADSPLSGDEAAEVSTPSPRKSRRGAQKRVVSVPIGDSDGSRSKTEVYPPPDSWSWRKYGQKPIKGSPYPRGYYRCSSSKGCPARKQVERSRLDPTTLVITYSCDHNHPLPTTTTKHHHHSAAATTTTSSTSSAVKSSTTTATASISASIPAKFASEGLAVFTYNPGLEPPDDTGSSFTEWAGHLGWFSDVGSTLMDSTTLVGSSSWADADVTVMLPIGEEDESLFGDLGELPECSVVFRRRNLETPCYGGTG